MSIRFFIVDTENEIRISHGESTQLGLPEVLCLNYTKQYRLLGAVTNHLHHHCCSKASCSLEKDTLSCHCAPIARPSAKPGKNHQQRQFNFSPECFDKIGDKPEESNIVVDRHIPQLRMVGAWFPLRPKKKLKQKSEINTQDSITPKIQAMPWVGSLTYSCKADGPFLICLNP